MSTGTERHPVGEWGVSRVAVVRCRLCPWQHVAALSSETQQAWNEHYVATHYVSPSSQQWHEARETAIRSRAHARDTTAPGRPKL